MSRSIRPRPIDFSKPMPVVKSQKELEVNEDGVLVPKDDALEKKGASGILDEDIEDEDLETIRILQEQYEKESKKANIPVPPIIEIDDYDKFVPKDFVRPQSYLRFKALSDKDLDDKVEYEMDEQDMEFLTKTVAAQKLQIKEEKFEQIVDRLEKESYKIGKMCEVSVLETHKLGGGKGVQQVYEYWRKKREKLGKALIRRFQPPTSISDNSPHSTFRPREKEEKRIRRTRKNDKDAHKKLKHLQDDFRRAKELLEHVVRREKMKKVLLELDFCLQFAKEIKDIPDHIRKQHETFFHELREKQRAVKQVAEPAGVDVIASRQRPAARPVGLPSEDEAILKADADAPEKLEGIKRCFQHLMMNWDEDGNGPGTCLLPVTSDLKLSTGVPNKGVQLIYRGRARMGRGGRVLFDRCSYRVASLYAEEDGLQAGMKRGWQRGGRSDLVGAVLEDMRSANDVSKKGEGREAKPCWDFGGVHKKLLDSPAAHVMRGVSCVMNSSNINGAATRDVQNQSLGKLSSGWVLGAGEPKKRLLAMQGLNGSLCNGALQKKRKVDDPEAGIASMASTTTGVD